MAHDHLSRDELLGLVERLEAEVAELKEAKQDLEALMKITVHHADFVEAELERTAAELERERSKLVDEAAPLQARVRKRDEPSGSAG